MPVMKFMRHKGFMKKVLWVIAIVIIIVFGFLGSANYLDFSGGSNRITHAGKAFGKKVSFEDFNSIKNETIIQLLMQYGDAFYKIREFLNINGQAWDRFILLKEARERGISVSDQEVVIYIQDIPFFQRNKQFDSLLYNDILRESFRMTPRSFEESVRNSIKLRKIYEQETIHVLVSPQEAKEEFDRSNEKVQVSYILFPPDSIPVEKQFSEKEAKTYYESHLNDFLKPPSINLKYVEFPTDSEVSDEALKVLTEEADEAYYEMLQVKNFEEAAAKRNLEIKETGFLYEVQEGKSQIRKWPFSFLQTAFKLKDGEISEPIKTNKGIYILQLKERREPFIPSYDEAAQDAQFALRIEEAKRLAKKKAERYYKILQEKNIRSREQFTDIAKSSDLEIHQTPAFTRGQYLEKIGLSKSFQESAFQLSKTAAGISDVVETDAGYCILHMDSYIPTDEKEFEEKKDEIVDQLRAQKQSEAFNEFLNTMRLQANLEDYISELEKIQ